MTPPTVREIAEVARNRRENAVTNQPPNSGKKRRAGAEDVEIGRKIRALRLQRGLSQSGLADGIG
jgi:ribosome-binding protein aMBF1 (putative translation factor)